MMKLSILLVTYLVMIMAKTMITIRFYYFALTHVIVTLYTKTSISDKPILDLTPGRKAM